MIYAVVHLNVANPDALKAYAAQATDALAKHGAKPMAASASPTLIEGTAELADRVVILEFPDEAAVQAWMNDPELQEVHALRGQIGTCDIVVLT